MRPNTTSAPSMTRHHPPPREIARPGARHAMPLDRNAKVRIMVYAKAWSAQHRQGRQHRGPITRAFMEVLEAMLWGFHNSNSSTPGS